MTAAEVALDALRDRVRAGDRTVTALDLAAAHATVELEALRAEAAGRHAESPEELDRQRRVAEYEARRREDHERDLEAQRASWQRAIDSGAAEQQFRALQVSNGGTPSFPPEYLALLREQLPHLFTAEGATA